MNRTLEGRITMVTGASRGAGRAIANVLGERGATVYVTGRSVRGRPTPDGMPGTIEDTASEVTERGGRGIPVRCDHTVDAEVAALFQRVRAEHGRLDLLVNNAWGGYEGRMAGLPQGPFWTQEPGFWDSMFTAGVRTTLDASRLAAPLMVERGRGVIVHVVAWMDGAYLGHLYYDLAKSTTVRMAFGMARELRAHGVAVVALAPGFMRTERVMAAHAAYPFDLGRTESPEYLGRAVAALVQDAEVMRWSGQVLDVGTLAREYGFTDVDGAQPVPFRMPVAEGS